jgi:polyhydroxyalkanoate synthesis regulator phasin
VLAAGALALLAAGCGGEEAAVCEDLDNIQSSVDELRDVELGEGALDEVQRIADDLLAEAQAAQTDAEAELGDELGALQTSVQGVVSEVETAAASGVSAESLQAISAAISATASSFQAVQDAAPDC